MDYKSIIKDIKSGNVANNYFLHGEEPFYIDEITKVLTESVVEEHARDFDQVVLYGKDTEIGSLLAELKAFPMIATKKLVVVREAQSLKDIQLLEDYFMNPQPSTVFVINYKYGNFDSRKKVFKAASKHGLVFKSEKIKDYNLADWIRNYMKSIGLDITSKAAMLLSEFLGNDLGRIVNEIEKLKILLEKGTTVNDIHIEENIGISKDYNVYELTKAIQMRDIPKAFTIVDYFDHNPKVAPMMMVIPTIFKLHTQLMRIHFLPNKSREAVASALKLPPFIANDLIAAAKIYNAKKLATNIAILEEYDLKSKGIGSTGNMTQGELMKEMIYRLLN